jgi:heme o synthase
MHLGTVKTYYRLTKPGIIYGNSLSVLAGFFLASAGHVNFYLLLVTLLGVAFVMASACVTNNIVDVNIDRAMDRTKNRALVTGQISKNRAIIFATILGTIGFLALAKYTNLLTVLVGAVGYLGYVVLYGIGKRKTVHSTLIGTISGAMPPVAGYLAVTGSFDIAALLLFFILVFWQMPHFYAIAIFRKTDYARAKIPLLTVVKGNHQAKIQMVIYITLFIAATSLMTAFGYTGYTYLATIVALAGYWLAIAIKGLTIKNDIVIARQIFKLSLVVLLVFCLLVSFGKILP